MSIRIRYACPHCGRRIVHHPELAGQLVICSACKGEFYEPTDPLPGKPAEEALQPLPEATRRLRVPEGSNPRHDLAVLARRDASDMRSIIEIVEAVLLDDDPAAPAPGSADGQGASGADEAIDFGHAAPGDLAASRRSEEPAVRPRPFQPPAIPAQSPHANAMPAARTPAPRPQNPALPAGLAGSAVRPLVPPSAVIPASVGSPPLARPIPKPAVPVSSSARPAAADRPLAGISVNQMTEELRRRGLGAAILTCDIASMGNFQLAFTDNMTQDDAAALLRKYLDTLHVAKPAEQAGLLSRMWKKSQGE